MLFFHSPERDETLITLREQAKALITFAGRNQGYHMPGDTYSRLVRMELHMA